MNSKYLAYAAVIKISNYRENPDRALRSILRLKAKFPIVYMVSKDAVKYDKDKYSELTIEQVPRFQKKKVPADIDAILLIPPHCSFTAGTLDKLEVQVRESHFVQQTFSIRTVESYNPTEWKSWWLYGLIVVMTVWDFFHMRFDRYKIYRGNDIVMLTLTKKCGKKFVSSPYGNRLLNVTCAPSLYDEHAVVKSTHNDFNYILRNLKTHPHYGWGLWMFFFFFFYCWNIVLTVMFVQKTLPLFVLGCIWVAMFCTIELITSPYMKLKYKYMYSMLFPLFVLMFPFVAIYARYHIPKKYWK